MGIGASVICSIFFYLPLEIYIESFALSENSVTSHCLVIKIVGGFCSFPLKEMDSLCVRYVRAMVAVSYQFVTASMVFNYWYLLSVMYITLRQFDESDVVCLILLLFCSCSLSFFL